jgi:hypothetical protein
VKNKTVDLAVLYADICDSVRYYEHAGDARGHQMAENSMQCMCDITEAQRGTLVRTQGDGVMSVFPSGDAAFDAAVAMQEAHREAEVDIKVAFSFGPVIQSRGEVYGDTVHLAARLLDLARSGETLLPEATLNALSGERGAKTRFLDNKMLKGRSQPVGIFVVNANTADPTGGFSTTLVAVPATANHAFHADLLLTLGGETLRVGGGLVASAVIGRAPECDLVLGSHLASRRHAKIERMGGYFRITDQSTNGTYVLNDANELLFLRRESTQLIGSGLIACGEEPTRAEERAVRYRYDGEA